MKYIKKKNQNLNNNHSVIINTTTVTLGHILRVCEFFCPHSLR